MRAQLDHSRISLPRISLTKVALPLCIALGLSSLSQPAQAGWTWLDGIYDSTFAETEAASDSKILRRRPGYPPPPQPIAPDINEGAIDPPVVIDQVGEFVPVPDRWRIMESLGFKYPWYDPYNQNEWKGDKPFRGEDEFLVITAISDTLLEPRSIPTPVAPQSPSDPGENDTLGDINQSIFAQTLIGSIFYYKGDTTFKPADVEYKATLAFNYNRVQTQERRALQIDPSFDEVRDDGFVGVQELFATWDLRNMTARYDFDDLRIGIQPFSSDFRGFLFQDNPIGIRLFGTRDSNRWQYNLALFRRLEKDLNSGLNDVTESPRDDDIFVANLYRQDFPFVGFTSQATILHNRNRETDSFYDSNGFIQRPAAIGREAPREYDVTYLGYSGDGHFGRFNLTTSMYYSIGDQSQGVFVADGTDIRAGFFAAEGSMDFDWIRVRGSVAYASGDDDPFDDRSNGFDAVFENPIFAGADTSYWIRQNIPLIGGGGVALSTRNGLLANLRSSKEQGQSNFDNPGLRLIGVGADFDLTPQSRVSTNVNQLWFDQTEILETARNQANIDSSIGTDVSVAWTWRPYATQNIVWRLSGAMLFSGEGLDNLYGADDNYYTVLGNLILTY